MDITKNNLSISRGFVKRVKEQIKDIYEKLEQVFQSVSNGKENIAKAITDMGVETLGTDTFQTMADNISSIKTGDPYFMDFKFVIEAVDMNLRYVSFKIVEEEV